MSFALKTESHVACIEHKLGEMDQILLIKYKGPNSEGRLQGLVPITALLNVF